MSPEEQIDYTRKTISVDAIGTSNVSPDLCHMLIRVTSQKGTASQAKDSVERRILYIKQAIQNSYISESDVKTFNSMEPAYISTTEIYITCSDIAKIESLRDTLIRKLDDSVHLSSISFSISTSALSHARTQCASNAVQNARRKAAEMARLVEGSLGCPLTIQQSANEEAFHSLVFPTDQSQFSAWQKACMLVKTCVRVIFELKPRKN